MSLRTLVLSTVAAILSCFSSPSGQAQTTLRNVRSGQQASIEAPPNQLAVSDGEPITAMAEPLSLEALEQLASANNPTLIQANAQLRNALGKALQAGLYPNPVVGYSAEQIGVQGTAGEFHGGFVQQEIITAGKRRLSRQKYLARASVAEAQIVAQQLRVMNDLRIHFYRALGAAQQLEIQHELLQSEEDSLITAQEMFNLGQANRADVHLAEVALARERLDLRSAENDYRMAWQELTAVAGVHLPQQPLAGSLEGDTTPIEFDAALQTLLAESPELAMARAKLRSDRLTIQRERVEPIPNIVVQGTAGYNFEAEDAVAGAQVSIEVPIFDDNRGTIQQAQADYARQQGEIRRTELRLQRRLAQQYEMYLTALQHVSDYQSIILPAARSAYELRLEAYKEDRESWPEVLETQSTYYALRREYIHRLVDWRTSQTAIEGMLLTEGLQAPENPAPPGHIDAVPQPR